MITWLKSHIEIVKLVLARMRTQRTSTFLIALVIGVATCLPGLFYLSVDHAAKFSSMMKGENELSVFISLSANQDDIDTINTALVSHETIASHRFVPKAEAWDALQTKMRDNNNDTSAELLTENPLPDAFYVIGNTNDAALLESLKADLAQLPNVDHVLLNTDWSKRLAAILAIAKNAIMFIAFLLAVGLVVIIGNTIRMQIMTQRDEIEVSHLIGATNNFVRTPFLYAGAFYGLLGGLVGITIIAFSVNIFNHYIGNLSDIYSSDLSLAAFDLQLLLTIIIIAVVIGWLGAYFAVNRTLSSIIDSYNPA